MAIPLSLPLPLPSLSSLPPPSPPPSPPPPSLPPSSTAMHYLDYIGIIPVVIMEFVDGGCLRSFLNNFKKTVNPDSIAKKKTDFLLYGKQIAEGMNYLVSSQHDSKCLH